MEPECAIRRVVFAAVVDFFSELQALAQRSIVFRLIASPVTPPGELTLRTPLSTLVYNITNSIREQSAASSVHDNVTDCQHSLLRFSTRLIINRKSEALYLPIIVGMDIDTHRENGARDDCSKGDTSKKLVGQRSKSHRFFHSKNAFRNVDRAHLVAGSVIGWIAGTKPVIQTGKTRFTEASQ